MWGGGFSQSFIARDFSLFVQPNGKFQLIYRYWDIYILLTFEAHVDEKTLEGVIWGKGRQLPKKKAKYQVNTFYFCLINIHSMTHATTL